MRIHDTWFVTYRRVGVARTANARTGTRWGLAAVLALLAAIGCGGDAFTAVPDAGGSTAGGSSGSKPGGSGGEAGGNEPGGSGGSGSGGTNPGGGSGAPSTGGSSGGAAAELGTACTSDTECDSGYCVDGVCCESACGAACHVCNTEGRCAAVSADAACGACPTDDCNDYQAPSANNCVDGACAACAATPKAQGTACPNGECTGTGTCALSLIQCGATSKCKAYAGSVCCHKVGATAPESGCFLAATVCGGDSAWGMPNSTVRVGCDGDGDCPAGTACCLENGNGNLDVHCRPAAECPYNQGVVSRSIVCAGPGGETRSCPTGTTCKDYVISSKNQLPGFQVCQK